MIRIEKDTVVSFRYIIKNSRNEILEDTMNGIPTRYIHGTSDILPVLQDQLKGLRPGEKKQISLPKSSGLTLNDLIFDVLIDEVREASAEELLLGYPAEMSVVKCESDCMCHAERFPNPE